MASPAARVVLLDLVAEVSAGWPLHEVCTLVLVLIVVGLATPLRLRVHARRVDPASRCLAAIVHRVASVLSCATIHGAATVGRSLVATLLRVELLDQRLVDRDLLALRAEFHCGTPIVSVRDTTAVTLELSAHNNDCLAHQRILHKPVLTGDRTLTGALLHKLCAQDQNIAATLHKNTV